MKTRFASSIRLPLIAGALALVVAGCGSTDRYADRSSDRYSDRYTDRGSDRYAVRGSSQSIPPTIDPFSRSYIPFPGSANESAGIVGHSTFCVQHYNQPGCQTSDNARDGYARFEGGSSNTGAVGSYYEPVAPSRY
jgi:hypothetical protein